MPGSSVPKFSERDRCAEFAVERNDHGATPQPARAVRRRRMMIPRHDGQGETPELEAVPSKGVAGRQILGLADRFQKAIVELGVDGHVVIDKKQLSRQGGEIEAIPLEFGDRAIVDSSRPD